MSLRVLHVSQPVEAGVARYVADLAADQVQRGWDVAVAAPEGGQLAGWLHDAAARHVAWRSRREPGSSVAREVRSLARVIAAERPEVVHLHSAKAGLAGRLTIRGRIPTVFQPHAWSFLAVTGAVARAALAWERYAVRWSDRIVCVGDGEMADGRARNIGRLTVVRNGVDVGAWRPPAPTERERARSSVGVGPGEVVVVCVGRLTRQKAQDVLVRAWRQVREPARLLLVGDGPERDRVAAAAPPGVGFAGSVSDVRTYLWAADVVVQPSRWEGLSLSLLEGMACGRSIVATRLEGAVEALGHGSPALVPVEDEAALARALEDRIVAAELRDEEGRALRRRAEEMFDVRRTREAIARLYAEITQP